MLAVNQPEVLGPPSPTSRRTPVNKEFVGATAKGNGIRGPGPGYEVWPARMIEISARPAGVLKFSYISFANGRKGHDVSSSPKADITAQYQ